MRLSEARARNVSNEIVKGGAKTTPTSAGKGEEGATEDPTWRMVEIDVKDSRRSRRPSSTSSATSSASATSTPRRTPPRPASKRPVGTPVAHSALAQRLIPGQQPILAHHDESIMSNGEEVRPYHYVTFLEALGEHDRHHGHVGHPAPAPARAAGGRATSPCRALTTPGRRSRWSRRRCPTAS